MIVITLITIITTNNNSTIIISTSDRKLAQLDLREGLSLHLCCLRSTSSSQTSPSSSSLPPWWGWPGWVPLPTKSSDQTNPRWPLRLQSASRSRRNFSYKGDHHDVDCGDFLFKLAFWHWPMFYSKGCKFRNSKRPLSACQITVKAFFWRWWPEQKFASVTGSEADYDSHHDNRRPHFSR